MPQAIINDHTYLWPEGYTITVTITSDGYIYVLHVDPEEELIKDPDPDPDPQVGDYLDARWNPNLPEGSIVAPDHDSPWIRYNLGWKSFSTTEEFSWERLIGGWGPVQLLRMGWGE